MQNTTIQCPDCGNQIDVNDLLKHQIEESLRQEFIQEKKELYKVQKEKEVALARAQQEFEATKKRENEIFQERLEKERRSAKIEIEKRLKAQIAEENREAQKALQDELAEKSAKLKDFHLKEMEVEKLKRSISEVQEKAKLDAEKSLSIKFQQEKENLKKQVQAETLEAQKSLQAELAEKSEKLKELHRKEVEIEKLKRSISEVEEKAKVDAEKALSEELQREKARIQRQLNEGFELKAKEYKKQLEDQGKLIDEMKRKAEQGSMQLQGEVMELAIEEWLAQQFPLDTIDEIKKGATGADCLQTINTRERANCGTIYYESKRTKAFQPAWIEKFKNDIRQKNADIGVLVTEVMPSDMERMGLREGIWICSYQEFKGLCAVLRQSVVQWSRIRQNQENKGDKMGLLYDFLTSNQFRLQMEGIVEGFTQMQTDLQKEKNAMKRIWKQREKQIEKVVDNAIGMHASIRGIAGSAIQSIPSLELEDEETNLLDFE